MVDMGIASASTGADATSRYNGSRGRDATDDKGGFLNAMSNSASDRSTASARKDSDSDRSAKQATDSQAEDAAAADAKDTAAAAAAAKAGAKASPVADAMASLGLNKAQLAKLIAADGNGTSATDASQQATADAASPEADTKAAADAGSQAADASQTLAEAMQQLAAIAGEANASTNVKGGAADATGKPQTGASKDKSDDATADAAQTGAPGTVSDVLSLLNMAAQAQASSAAAAANGQLAANSAKPQGMTDTTASAQMAAISDVAEDGSADTASMKATALADAIQSSGKQTAKDSNDGTTGTFRVASATGRSQAIDLSISKAADDSAQVDVKAAGNSGTGSETVMVLDSRRYLGLADGSNSSLVASTLAGDKGWASAMKAGAASGVTSNTSKVVNTLKIEMNPERLGSVTATMRLSGDQLTVDLKVQSAEAYRQLSSDQNAMADSLRAQGYRVDHITVSYTPQAGADSGSQQNNGQSGFQGQQQSGASQGQGSEAQQRRQNSGQQTNDQDVIWRTQNGSTDDGMGNAQRGSSTGVYI